MTKNNNSKYWIKRLFPYAGLLALTAALMIFFRHNKNVDQILQVGADEISDFYLDNLKPLIFKTEITNEDAVNFALLKNLPIDKEKGDIIQVGQQGDKNNTYSFKPAVWNPNTNNYKKIINHYDLKENEVKKLDSILNIYRNELYASVLVNEKNTLAVNSNIHLLQKAIQNDLYNFFQNCEIKKNKKGTPVNFTFSGTNSYKDFELAFNEKPNDYLVFVKDSVFESKFDFDKEVLKTTLGKVHSNFADVKNEFADVNFSIAVNPFVANVNNGLLKLKFEIDSSYITAYLPNRFEELVAAELDSIDLRLEGLENIADIHRIRINSDTLEDNLVLNIEGIFEGSDEDKLTFEFNADGIKKITKNSINLIQKFNFGEWEDFGIKIDSLVRSHEYFYSDSSKGFDHAKFKLEMKKFKEEIKEKNSNLERKLESIDR